MLHDERPPTRWQGLVLGLALALPLAVIVFGVLVPRLVGTILGGAHDLDEQLQRRSAYISVVCNGSNPPTELCGCASQVAFASLQCRTTFYRWALEQHHQQCAFAGSGHAVAFCACIDQIHTNLEHAKSGEQPRILGAYEACAELDDALELPKP